MNPYTKHDDDKLAQERMEMYLDPAVREALRNPFGKQASSHSYSGSDKPSWVQEFRGTPMHSQAIDLQQQLIQLQAQKEQVRSVQDEAHRSSHEQREMLDKQEDALEMQKEMLLLDLERSLGAQSEMAVEPPPMGELPPEQEKAAMLRGVEDAILDFQRMRKTAAPVGLLGRGSAFLGAASQHLDPAVKAKMMETLTNRTLAGAAVGAAGGALTKDDNEGYLQAMGKGGLLGGALGAGSAAVSGASHLNSEASKLTAMGLDRGSALTAASNKMLTPAGHKQVRTDLKTMAREGGAAPGVPAKYQGRVEGAPRNAGRGMPAVPAQAAAPAAAMPDVPSLATSSSPVPDLMAASSAAHASSGIPDLPARPAVSRPVSPMPKVPVPAPAPPAAPSALPTPGPGTPNWGGMPAPQPQVVSDPFPNNMLGLSRGAKTVPVGKDIPRPLHQSFTRPQLDIELLL